MNRSVAAAGDYHLQIISFFETECYLAGVADVLGVMHFGFKSRCFDGRFSLVPALERGPVASGWIHDAGYARHGGSEAGLHISLRPDGYGYRQVRIDKEERLLARAGADAMTEWSEFDIRCMRLALEQAEKGCGMVSPNPPVGCVLASDDQIVAAGWHDHLGGLHAEQSAIADAEERGLATHGSVAYITLEPCNHHGRTPPCTEALLWAGVQEVVLAAADPNPTVRGGGAEFLREAGIIVRSGLLEDEARRQMAPFMHWCEHRRPLVTLKAAIDADGVVDNENEEAGRFTSEASLTRVHELRRESDAVLVGVNTVIRDDPELTVRLVPLGAGRQPLRIILDHTLRTPTTSRMVTDGEATLILHSDGDERQASALASDSVEVLRLSPLQPTEPPGVELDQLLDLLGDRGLQRVLIEGGPDVWNRFLRAGLVDEAFIIRTNSSIGPGPAAGIDATVLSTAGLQCTSNDSSMDDVIEHWLG